MKNMKGALILLLAALVWGASFVAQTAAADRIGSFTFNASRSILSSIFLVFVILVRKLMKKAPEVQDKKRNIKGSVIGGILCGICLFAAINFQQFGIAAYPSDVAASGRAGFLTATYVVMVSLFAVFRGKKIHPLVMLAAVGCVAGLYMLCITEGLSGIYLGDILLLICAVCFTTHILVVDRFSEYDGILISCVQFFACGLISCVVMFIFEKPQWEQIINAWWAIFYLGVFSGGVGYTLQIIGQKYAEPAVAAIVMSLESVFAALAGWLLINERMSSNELIGCVLVFAAVILAQIPELLKKREI